MRIAIDTRQQQGKHDLKHFLLSEMGHELVSFTVPVGDYIVASDEIVDVVERLGKKYKGEDILGLFKVSVDTKRDMGELYSDVCTDHERFHNECARAQENGIQLYILVENEDGITDVSQVCHWKNEKGQKRYLYKLQQARRHGWKKPRPYMASSALQKSCETMTERYGVQFLFCRPEESADIIVRLLEGGQP